MIKIFSALIISTSLLSGCATLSTPSPSTIPQLAEVTAVVTAAEAKACAEKGGYGALMFVLNADGTQAGKLVSVCVVKR